VRGYDGGKKVQGRKRHLLVDTLGLILTVVVHPANLSDARGAKLVLADLAEAHPTITRIWADMGYRGELAAWVATQSAATLEVVARPTRRGWIAPDADAATAPDALTPAAAPRGFTVLPRRWVVERTFAWLGRCRRLSKDYEGLAATEEAWIMLAMSRLMLHRVGAA
jgi:putative transposase